MDYQDYLHRTYFDTQAFDAEEFERMAELFDGVELFIDVGASHGVYTYQALRHLKGAHIVAIEADPERFAILEENVASWTSDPTIDTSTNSVECLFAAATDAEDLAEGPTARFFTTGTQISGGFFAVDERSDDYAPIEVPRVSLDQFADPNKSTFVKIDVEGGELRVLRGASKMLASGNAKFFVELSWWGDRERKTTSVTTLRFLNQQQQGITRRLRSDYLIFPEEDRGKRWRQMLRCGPPLFPRYAFAKLAPYPLRRAYIRRQNAQRLARMNEWTSPADQET